MENKNINLKNYNVSNRGDVIYALEPGEEVFVYSAYHGALLSVFNGPKFKNGKLDKHTSVFGVTDKIKHITGFDDQIKSAITVERIHRAEFNTKENYGKNIINLDSAQPFYVACLQKTVDSDTRQTITNQSTNNEETITVDNKESTENPPSYQTLLDSNNGFAGGMAFQVNAFGSGLIVEKISASKINLYAKEYGVTFASGSANSQTESAIESADSGNNFEA